MRFNFFVLIFLFLVAFPFLLLGCTRFLTLSLSLFSLPAKPNSVPAKPNSVPAKPNLVTSRTSVIQTDCDAGKCCIKDCTNKPVASLTALHYRRWLLCRDHIYLSSKLVEEAVSKVTYTYIVLSIFDRDFIKEVFSYEQNNARSVTKALSSR